MSSTNSRSKDGNAKGEICKICDRKFIIKSLLSNTQNEIESKNHILLGEHGLQA